jgi:hypothetical protein
MHCFHLFDLLFLVQVINQHLQQFQAPMMDGMGVELPSHSSSWETGYSSGHDNLVNTFSLP